MVPELDVDCGAVYERTRQSMLAFLRTLDDEQLATLVPATPLWTVLDALRHVVGITADFNAQRFEFSTLDEWTAFQVRTRSDDDVETLATEWDREAPKFEKGLRLFGHDFGAHYVGDLFGHFCDLTQALGVAPPDVGEALTLGLDFYLRLFRQAIEERALGRVDIDAGPQRWTLGSGRNAAVLRSTRYELFRALGGRRSEAQIRAMDWRGDVDALLPAVSPYPLPEDPIVETV